MQFRSCLPLTFQRAARHGPRHSERNLPDREKRAQQRQEWRGFVLVDLVFVDPGFEDSAFAEPVFAELGCDRRTATPGALPGCPSFPMPATAIQPRCGLEPRYPRPHRKPIQWVR